MANSALLVMDVQRDVVALADDGFRIPAASARDHRRCPGCRHPRDPRGDGVTAGRSRSQSPQQGDGQHRAGRPVHRGAPGTEIHDEVAPQQGDVVVTKRRGSAFSGSDLDLVLRARDIDSLVLTGIATSAVVLSTLWHAVDLDFGLTVLADACLDTDPEVHRMLTEKLFPQWADVVTVEDWLKAVAQR
ncbi:cysteine hydrolase [Streptomyces pseudogriseolus]|uniref:cysteine hydrolase family protein n=1 Tax=Streptomyces pseudogriseolus TaxID=36817 RepID=UPI0034997673